MRGRVTVRIASAPGKTSAQEGPDVREAVTDRHISGRLKQRAQSEDCAQCPMKKHGCPNHLNPIHHRPQSPIVNRVFTPYGAKHERLVCRSLFFQDHS